MYKNQLQELAQRSCFNLPSYTCIREGPDHAPRFKAVVNFNGETFDSPHYYTTLRQAEHAAAEVALNSLSTRGPSHSLAARILDETGVYKNLLQEISQRVGSPLPQYTTFRSGLGHLPVFTGTVELAGITFTGEPAKNKKQAEKNAALSAWFSLKQLAQQDASSSSEQESSDEQEQIRIARALLNYKLKEKINVANSSNASAPFQKKYFMPPPRPSSPQRPAATSKILPFFSPKSVYQNTQPTAKNETHAGPAPPLPKNPSSSEARSIHSQRFPVREAAPYVPFRQYRSPYAGIAPPVTMRTSIPVYSAPPLSTPTAAGQPRTMQSRPVRMAPPVSIRQAVPVFAAPPAAKGELPNSIACSLLEKSPPKHETSGSEPSIDIQEATALRCLEHLEI
ncbi:OLC1v1003925C1 [Oldenlandia corymbosa var. corymbosa]|uniref:OLC1v1003925C1 n=1 Tax=Oldenlandia corymbosa var. corymbosa TaxID=529605 RepID=A0AAV1DDH8_OLDCO|nr:OLC1v1003925C1 [Oldenlandia corymbosa var. corymbosa]